MPSDAAAPRISGAGPSARRTQSPPWRVRRRGRRPGSSAYTSPAPVPSTSTAATRSPAAAIGSAPRHARQDPAVVQRDDLPAAAVHDVRPRPRRGSRTRRRSPPTTAPSARRTARDGSASARRRHVVREAHDARRRPPSSRARARPAPTPAPATPPARRRRGAAAAGRGRRRAAGRRGTRRARRAGSRAGAPTTARTSAAGDGPRIGTRCTCTGHGSRP